MRILSLLLKCELINLFIIIIIINSSADGGQLIDYILRMYSSLNELLIIEYMKQLLSALEYIHQRQIVHLDVKVLIN